MITVSIGQGSGISPDFTSFAAFWATVPSTVLDDYTVNLLWASSANEFVDVNSNLTGKTWGNFRLTIQAGAGMSFRDHASKNTNPLRYNNAVGACWRVNGGNDRCFSLNTGNIRLTIRGIQFKCTSAGSHVARCLDLNNTFEELIEDNLFEGAGNNAALVSHLTGGPGANPYVREYIGRIQRNVFHAVGGTTTAILSRNGSKTQLGEFYNNTAVCTATSTTGTGFSLPNTSGANEYRMVNNVSAGFANDYTFPPVPGGSGVGLKQNNATTKASGSSGLGVHSSNRYSIVPSTEFENVTTATADFRVRDAAADLLGNADGAYARNLDVYGNPQSGLPDIGAHENQNQGPAPQFAFMKRRSPQMGGLVNLDFPRIR